MGTMGLMGWTIMLMVPVQQLPVRPLLHVLCQRHLINGSMGAHHSLCMAQAVISQGTAAQIVTDQGRMSDNKVTATSDNEVTATRCRGCGLTDRCRKYH